MWVGMWEVRPSILAQCPKCNAARCSISQYLE